MKSADASNARVARDAEEFERQLERQLGYLRKSSCAFDAGDEDEAQRIAAALRVLLYDRGTSISLLTHLSLHDEMPFVNTGVYPEAYEAAMHALNGERNDGFVIVALSQADTGLVDLGLGRDGQPKWFAPLRTERFLRDSPPGKASPRLQRFDVWWNDGLVAGSSGRTFCRRELVTIVANQDGGHHVDANFSADMNSLYTDSYGTAFGEGDIDDPNWEKGLKPPAGNVAFASIRQIAFEVLMTFELRKRGSAAFLRFEETGELRI